MTKVDAALGLVRALDAMRSEVSEANADALLAAFDALLLLPEAEAEPTKPPEPPERQPVYGWMRDEA